MKHLILGSTSPRRKEIVNHFTLSFEQVAPLFDEKSVQFQGDPIQYVHQISKGKVDSLMTKYPEAIIMTADTVVYRNGKIYNKPENEDEAFCFLSELVGQWHSVFTSITLFCNQIVYQDCEETRVLFNPLTAKEIRLYHEKVHWADKAGGYAIEMGGGLIVRKIDGCYFNVLGLPINTFHSLLKKVGIELWKYVK